LRLVQRFFAAARARGDELRLRDEVLLVLAVRRVPAVRRVLAVRRELVLLRAGAFRVVAFGDAPSCTAFSSCLARSCAVFRVLLRESSISLIKRRELASAFARSDLARFSAESRDVWIARTVGLPPVERRALAVVFRADDERPLALRLVLLRAVVRFAPVFEAVLRVAVLRAAGDIKLLSLGGRGEVYFIRRMTTQAIHHASRSSASSR
jgi:hypothetical protein